MNNPSKKKKTLAPQTSKNDIDVKEFLALFKIIKAIPLKSILAFSSFAGGLPIVGYFVYISYQPSLDASSLSFLISQALLASGLIALVFSSLFATALIASGSPAANPNNKENQDKKGRITAFLLVMLAHFPILFMAFAQESQWWWLGFGGCIFTYASISLYRYILIKKTREAPAECETKHDAGLENKQTTNERDCSQEQPSELVKNDQKIDPKMRPGRFYLEHPVNAFVMVISAPVVLVLMSLIKMSPDANQSSNFELLLIWGLFAAANGLLAISKTMGLFSKVIIACSVIFFTLAYFRLLHFPVTAIARIIGIGQIANADLTLSESRCLIVQRQLNAAGMQDVLTCQGNKPNRIESVAADASKMNDYSNFPGVLKNVMLLSRVGTEYYIEISKQKKPISSTQRGTSAANEPLLTPSSKVQTSSGANELPERIIVRLNIPKTDASELVYQHQSKSTNNVAASRPR
ncbi:MAG: hypothetical protein H6R01_213 [Burkholderiaceae bacterium]|nr:hypothetical protein [Burkholderiaceae bacterium]